MNIKFILSLSIIACIGFTSCKKDDSSTISPVSIQAAATARMNANGTKITFSGVNAANNKPAISWSCQNNVVSLIGTQVVGTDTLLLVIHAKVNTGFIGTYSLNWKGSDGVSPTTNILTNCYYGKKCDFVRATSNSPIMNAAGEYLPIPNVEGFSGAGSFTISSCTKNEISGTFHFSDNLSGISNAIVTDGQFSRVKLATNVNPLSY